MNVVYNIRATSIIYAFLKKNIIPGKTWMIPVNTCHFIPACFIKANTLYEFVDVNPLSLSIDESDVLERLKTNSKKYAGVFYVRNYGESKINDEFFKKAKNLQPSLKIIDDACLSFPDLETPISPYIDLELYSTGYSKPIDLGYGGFGKLHNEKGIEFSALPYKKDELDLMNSIYTQSIKSLETINFDIFKASWLDSSEIDEQQYVKKIKEKFSDSLNHKKNLNNIYMKNINPEFHEPRLSNNWRFNVNVGNASDLMDKIFTSGLFASQHYFPLNKIFDSISCPIWEKEYSNIINLFNDYRFSENQANKICDIINEFGVKSSNQNIS